MVELKQLHEEIASLLKKEFGLDKLDMGDGDCIKELNFKLKSGCDGTKIKQILKTHFGSSLIFHACEMGGVLGILIENNCK